MDDGAVTGSTRTRSITSACDASAQTLVVGGAPEASGRSSQVTGLAEREGFEPSVEGLPLHVISRSAAKPPDTTPSHLSCSNDETADEHETG